MEAVLVAFVLIPDMYLCKPEVKFQLARALPRATLMLSLTTALFVTSTSI